MALVKQQVVVIHGGTAFATYEDYLNFLQHREVTIDYFKPHSDWKGGLQENLGADFEVLLPSMPNKVNAKYEEWKMWFERVVPFIEDGVILVGHSLGGIFLFKYLSEHALPKQIKVLLSVAAPFRSVPGFEIKGGFDAIQAQVPKIVLFHSKDDAVVPFSDAEEYQQVLPQAAFRLFDDRGHFNSYQFPEIVEAIKKYSNV